MEPCSADEFFQALNHAEQTFKKMENYLRHKQLCDVILVAGDRRIPAHRLVLSSVSDYFAAMFTNDVREARQEEIKMEGVEPNSLWSLIQYAYTGRLELKEDNIECLLSTACLLQLSQVVEACCKFLMKQLHPSNCLGIRSFADAQGCTDLHKVAHNYTMVCIFEKQGSVSFVPSPVVEGLSTCCCFHTALPWVLRFRLMDLREVTEALTASQPLRQVFLPVLEITSQDLFLFMVVLGL
uniref:BTB domain-containing protein n=1 Tax=Castor canadensis TaxID=51338 RepID=A0A8C0XKC5_CASCN